MSAFAIIAKIGTILIGAEATADASVIAPSGTSIGYEFLMNVFHLNGGRHGDHLHLYIKDANFPAPINKSHAHKKPATILLNANGSFIEKTHLLNYLKL